MKNQQLLHIEKKSRRDGGGYHAYTQNRLSEALLFNGLDNTIEIKWFSVDENERGKGLGEKMMQEISSFFPEKKVVPTDILPEAKMFWIKMKNKGFCEIGKTLPC